MAKKKEEKVWYFGTRKNKWYLTRPSKVPEYKRKEFVTQAEMKKIGRARAKAKVLSPSFV